MSAISPAPAPARTTRDLAKEKEARQKKVLAVLSVVFLAIVGFQLPRFMGGSATATPTPTQAAPAPVPAETPVTPGAQLPDTDRVVVEPQSGQLLSFGLFKSKDPFVQQLGTETTPAGFPTPSTPTTAPQPHNPPTRVSTTPALTTPTLTTPGPRLSPVEFPPSTTPAPTPQPPPVVTTPTSAPPPPSPPAPTSTQPSAPPVPATTPGTVALVTNGVCEIVALRGTFPGDEDLFRVVSIAKDGKSVRIGVVGGAYDSGAASATLKRGEKLTLVNTADGTRYVIRLLASCDVETEAALPTTTTATTPATAVAPPTTPTLTTGEQIVEDELDNGSAEDAASQGD